MDYRSRSASASTARYPAGRGDPPGFVISFRFLGAAESVTSRPDLHRSLRRLMDDVELDGDVVRVCKELPADVEPGR